MATTLTLLLTCLIFRNRPIVPRISCLYAFSALRVLHRSLYICSIFQIEEIEDHQTLFSQGASRAIMRGRVPAVTNKQTVLKVVRPKLCGNEKQKPMKSSTNRLHVTFLSDETINAKGFNVTWTAGKLHKSPMRNLQSHTSRKC